MWRETTWFLKQTAGKAEAVALRAELSRTHRTVRGEERGEGRGGGRRRERGRQSGREEGRDRERKNGGR